MTIQEAHITFKLLYDKVDSISKPEFKREEVDLLLNIAQEKLVKKYYTGNNPQKKGFEVTEKRTDDLRNYVATSNILLNSSYYKKYDTYSDSYQIAFTDLPASTVSTLDNSALTSPYWFTLRQSLLINDLNPMCEVQGKEVGVQQVQNDDLNDVLVNPFKEPTFSNPVSVFKNYIELYVGGTYNYTRYAVVYRNRYIFKPTKVSFQNNITFKCSDHFQLEIIEFAKNIAIESIKSDDSKTFITNLLEQD